MRVRYTATAERELASAIEYLGQNASSIVKDFADAVDRGVTEVADFPFSAQKTEKMGVRRKYIRRFHYCVFYVIENNEIIVIHIRHAAQRLPWEDDGRR